MRASWTDRLLRLLGADPAVFRPFYRVQKLLLARSTRAIRTNSRRPGHNLLLLCLIAVCYGLGGASLMVRTRTPALGGGLALTLAGVFLLLIVFANHAEALVLPAERLVLAAHPHDDRSLLLAKLAAVLRLMAIVAAWLFAPTALATLRWGPVAALAFLAGAAAATVAATVGGLLLAALLVRAGSRRLMERVMPWTQVVLQLGFLVPSFASSLFYPDRLPARAQALMAWLLPSFWFAAPLELAVHGSGSPAAWERLALAAATVVALLAAAAGLAGGLGRSLLEPETRHVDDARHPAAARRRGRPRRPGRREGASLWRVLGLYLRGDWRNRADVLSVPLVGLVFLFVYSSKHPSAPSAWGGRIFYCWMLFLSADSLTRSRRPERLWWLLISPIDRTRFSLATVAVLRLTVLLPMTAGLIVTQTLHGSPADRLQPAALWMLAALVVAGDLLLVLGKVAYPAFPFSRGRDGDAAGDRFVLALIGIPVVAAVILPLALCQHFGTSGLVTAIAAGALLHLPAHRWARRRAAHAAGTLDLTALG